jgi:hypothetical protein
LTLPDLAKNEKLLTGDGTSGTVMKFILVDIGERHAMTIFTKQTVMKFILVDIGERHAMTIQGQWQPLELIDEHPDDVAAFSTEEDADIAALLLNVRGGNCKSRVWKHRRRHVFKLVQ